MYVLSMLFIVLLFIVVLILDIHAECSRSYVRYMCFVQYSSLKCFGSHSVQCVVSSLSGCLLKAVAS